jgi:three-Cys-motif partner protein
MKNKWSSRIYVELYAGAGFGRIKGTSKLLIGSPLLAIQVKDGFDKYVFCEEIPENLEALRNRAKRIAPDADITYILGNCNNRIREILAAIPAGSKKSPALSLCFADPFDISLEFETIRTLAKSRFMDFLVLLALGMDASRNYEHYIREDSEKVDKFLGSSTWRLRWAKAQWDAVKFTRFLADEFTASMAAVDYIPPPRYMMKEVKLPEKNVPLYRLALFSRNQLAYKYWDQVLKYGTDQTAFEGW